MKIRAHLKKILIALFLLLAGGGVGYYWLKLPYDFPMQREIAENFIQLVMDNKLDAAYEMTSRTGYTGLDYEEFLARVNGGELPRSTYKFMGVDPIQSNGNRLRRWLRGQTVDPDRVSFEFQIPLLSVYVCRMNDNQWKVCRFNTHAG